MDGHNKKQLFLDQLKWMTIYLGISFVIMILLPFPIDLAIALTAFLLLSLYRRKLLLRKLGIEFGSNKSSSIDIRNIKEFLKSISFRASHSTDYGHRQIKYYCMKCSNEHREISCPKCGSKMKRIGL
jgi:hypothetical protein